MEDGGEQVVFAGGWAVGGGLEVVVYSCEFTIVLWCAVDEPADFVGIVVDGDGGGFGGAVGVVAGDCCLCELTCGEVCDGKVKIDGCVGVPEGLGGRIKAS